MAQHIDRIESVSAFVVEIPRDVPYLGPLRPGEFVNRRGYIVRQGNRTLYPTADRSVVLRITTEAGLTGWGETYGIVAPEAVRAIIEDVVAPVLEGRDPSAPAVIHEDLYDLMRVRGFFGGFYLDSLAAVDIALWDLLGKRLGAPVSTLLGGRRHATIPAYVSGLPRATLAERVDFARDWQAKGFRGFKFAAVVADDGVEAEMAALREGEARAVSAAAHLHQREQADRRAGLGLVRLAAFGKQVGEHEIRVPAQNAGRRRHGALDPPAPAALGREVVHEQHVPARANHARHLGKQLMRVGHHARGEHGDRGVEAGRGKGHVLGIHLQQAMDMRQPLVGHLVARLEQHVAREVDAHHLQVAAILRQGEAGAYAHFQHAPARQGVHGRDRALAAEGRDAAEHHVIDARPAAIGLAHRSSIQRGAVMASFGFCHADGGNGGVPPARDRTGRVNAGEGICPDGFTIVAIRFQDARACGRARPSAGRRPG
jgi:hypothetical protein